MPATADRTFFGNVNERQFSQELTLISPDTARVSYLLGAFAMFNKHYFLPPFQFVSDNSSAPGPASEYRLDGTNPNRSLAGFGQLGFAITPTLKVELGGRYTSSRSIKHVRILQFGVPITAEQRTTSDNFSHKASIGWAANRNNYLYAFVASGWGDRATLTPRVNYGHIAPQWATLFENRAQGDRIVERNIVNAQLALNVGSVTATAYATNLTDQHYPAALNSGLYFAGPPRQYGVKLLKTF